MPGSTTASWRIGSAASPPNAGFRSTWAAIPWADASRQRCAIYTRKSSEERLEQEFNSLAAQCDACEAFIRSQGNEGWVLVRTRYDDGGFSDGGLERPALQHLIADTALAVHVVAVRDCGKTTARWALPLDGRQQHYERQQPDHRP
jgi:Resolvase, N terminal domain